MRGDYLEGGEKIGSPGKRVEIDESKFGKRKYDRGHKIKRQSVFGSIEEGSRKISIFLHLMIERKQHCI